MTVFGKRARSSPLSFIRILSVSSRAWPPLPAIHFVRATARNYSVKEATIVHLSSGDPEAAPVEYWLFKWTLYGFCCSPCHWYDIINAIPCLIGLTPSIEDPCLYTGFVHDPSNPSSVMLSATLSLGMYVDDFVYFSKDPAVEPLFCCLLAKQCKVEFMGIVE